MCRYVRKYFSLVPSRGLARARWTRTGGVGRKRMRTGRAVMTECLILPPVHMLRTIYSPPLCVYKYFFPRNPFGKQWFRKY